MATYLEDQITALPNKLFVGIHKEVDGKDCARTGEETQTTPSSREVFPGTSWNTYPRTEGTGGTVSGLCSRDGIIKDFGSDQFILLKGDFVNLQSTVVVHNRSPVP